MLAFAAIKGGIYSTPINPLARDVPAVFIAGEEDLPGRIAAILVLYDGNRTEEPAGVLRWSRIRGPRGFAVDFVHRKIIPPGKPPDSTGRTVWFPDASVVGRFNGVMSGLWTSANGRE